MRRSMGGALALALGLIGAVSCTYTPSPPRTTPATASGPSPWSLRVTAALEKAGANRAELERVLTRYRDAGDDLKFRAAAFLIENMEGHSFAELAFYDSTHTAVPFDVLAYPDFTTLEAAFDTLEAAHGPLDYDARAVFKDLEMMKADLLIENLDLAFRAWREKPWARQLSFDDFCAYVLPYRGSNEPLESWRRFFLARYANLVTRMQDPSDPIEASVLINRDLNRWFRFDPRYYYHPTDQGLSEMLKVKLGRCEDMTNLTIFAMRANGLGVTSDYTPFWADASNNHAWNAILDRQGKVIMFMGAEADPGSYRLSGRAAKVYRKTFALQRDNLAFRKSDDEKVPGWLGGKNYSDVTAAYQPVANVTLALQKAVPDSVHHAYICVFNTGEWQPIHWAPIEDGRATFTDMGMNIAYLPAFFVHQKVVPAAPAFILQSDGIVRPLVARPGTSMRLRLVSTTRRAQVESTDGVQPTFLEPGREYELFYWKDEWVTAGKALAGTEPLEFADVPEGVLYWLLPTGSSRDEERIFTYESNAQVWW